MDNESQRQIANILKKSQSPIYKSDEEIEERYNRQQSELSWNLLSKSNIPERHKGNPRIDNQEWIEKLGIIQNKIGSGFIMALIGIRGSGKTQMAVECIKESCKRRHSAFYTTAMEIFMAIKSGYNNDMDESQILLPFKKVELLVIDEAQERGETDWENRLLTHLVDHRYSAVKDTIIISNQMEIEFAKSMGTSIISRIKETGGIILCNWESFR